MKNDKIRILYVNGGLMDRGGISSVMMNYYKNIRKDNIQIDFMVHGKGKGVWDDVILSNGSNIYHVTPKSANFFKNVSEMINVYKKEKYDIVHAHADAGNAHILKYAKKCGIPIRISHSHNTDYTISNKLRRYLNDLSKKQLYKYATEQWACSRDAGRWLYGETDKFEIIHNAINPDKYMFSDKKRESIRNRYQIGDSLLIGMCGRLDTQKNQKYGIRILSELKKRKTNAKLIIIGDGCLKEQLYKQVADLGLSKDVIFTGGIDNVEDYYSAMDIFIMPSLFEGFGIVALEAQCNGLKCIISDKITREVGILPDTAYIPINVESVLLWCSEIEKMDWLDKNRGSCRQLIANAGYDINIEADKLKDKYINLMKKLSF